MAGKNVHDPELKAMATLVQAMDPLDSDQRNRVREWFVARYGDTSGFPAPPRLRPLIPKPTGYDADGNPVYEMAKGGQAPGSDRPGYRDGQPVPTRPDPSKVSS